MMRHVLRASLLATLVAGLLVPAAACGAPKRIVALEWDAIENLRALGIKPVGAADLGGYRTYVSIGLPGGITDVGRRQEPSLERIANLKPDLIVVPGYRSGSSLKTLRKIAKVLVTNPYPGSTANGAQFNAMVKDFRALGKAVGKPKGAEAVLRDMSRTFSSLRKRLSGAKRGGTRVTIATPGGTSSSPAVRLFTNNSASAEIVRRLGLAQRVDGVGGALRLLDRRRRGAAQGAERLAGVRLPRRAGGPDQALHGPELLQAADVRQEASTCATCAGTRGCSAARCPRRSSPSA